MHCIADPGFRNTHFSWIVGWRAHDSVCSCQSVAVECGVETQTGFCHKSWMEHWMPRFKKRTPEVENVRAYVEGVAKNLCDKLYGPDGPVWGTKLTEIEDVCLDIREILTEQMLAESLRRQAEASVNSASETSCPSCGESLNSTSRHPRKITTRAGEAAWVEPEAHCRQCRRAFFPSVEKPGH
jgi:hypothetical protein